MQQAEEVPKKSIDTMISALCNVTTTNDRHAAPCCTMLQ